MRKQFPLFFGTNLVRRTHHQLTRAWKISLECDIEQPILFKLISAGKRNKFSKENEYAPESTRECIF